MNPRRSTAFLLALLPAFAGCASGPAKAARPPMEESLLAQVPADAQLCVAWNVLEHPDYAGSRLAKFHALSQRQPLSVENIATETRAAFALLDPEKKADPRLLDAAARALAEASVHGGAFYLRGVRVDEKTGPAVQDLAAVLVIHAGERAEALAAELSATLAPLKRQFPRKFSPIAVDRQGDAVRVSWSVAGKAPAVEAGKDLAHSARWRAATAGMGRDGALVAYLDAESLVAQLKGLSAWQKSQGKDDFDFAKVDAVAGLSGLKSLAMTGGFTADGQWRTDCLVQAPAPRRGIVGWMDGATVDGALLRRVPASAEGFAAAGFDLSGTLADARALGDQVADGKMEGGWMMAMGFVKAKTRIDLPATLEGLGTQWLVFSDPMAAGGGLAGLVLLNPLKNPAVVTENLKRAGDLGTQALRAEMAKARTPDTPETKAGFFTDAGRGVSIERFGFPLVSPGYAVQDGTLIAGLLPQPIQAAARPVAHPLVDTADYQAFMAQLAPAGVAPRMIAYRDLARVAPHDYGSGLCLYQLVLGWSEMVTGKPAPMQLPVLADLMPLLGPSGAVTWTDAAGLHVRAEEPFPSSHLVAGGVGGSAAVASTALMAGILVPVLGEAKKSANNTLASVNERNLEMGAEVYANSNKEWYPGWTARGQRAEGDATGLAHLLAEDSAAPKMLAAPGDDAALEAYPSADARDPKKLDAWCRAHSAYIFLPDFRPTKSDQNSRRIDLFMDPAMAVNPKKIPATFGDCHVEIQMKEDLDAALREQYGADSDELARLWRAKQPLPAK